MFYQESSHRITHIGIRRFVSRSLTCVPCRSDRVATDAVGHHDQSTNHRRNAAVWLWLPLRVQRGVCFNHYQIAACALQKSLKQTSLCSSVSLVGQSMCVLSRPGWSMPPSSARAPHASPPPCVCVQPDPKAKQTLMFTLVLIVMVWQWLQLYWAPRVPLR